MNLRLRIFDLFIFGRTFRKSIKDLSREVILFRNKLLVEAWERNGGLDLVLKVAEIEGKLLRVILRVLKGGLVLIWILWWFLKSWLLLFFIIFV